MAKKKQEAEEEDEDFDEDIEEDEELEDEDEDTEDEAMEEPKTPKEVKMISPQEIVDMIEGNLNRSLQLLSVLRG